MLKVGKKLWERGRRMLPVSGFCFDRPIVVLQSDDWGRVGLRDHQGLEQLRAAGIALGERPYDFYTLETCEDLAALRALLKSHRDSIGRHPCLGMNFILANLDFDRILGDAANRIAMRALADGLPEGWNRPGLFEAYREGIAEGVFSPALHGIMHFCLDAVGRTLDRTGERTELLHTLWHAGTPYIHWRMPWIGYEYWDQEKAADEQFLPADRQLQLVGEAVGGFAKMFARLPRSACAPGYRANDATHRAWALHGIRVAQNGPGALVPPHIDRHGVLQVFRTVEFEPATDPVTSLESCLRQIQACFGEGIPAVVSVHAINFHSTVKDFRGRTLPLLDELLTALEARHTDLLYLHDDDLYAVVTRGMFETTEGRTQVNVTRRSFSLRGLSQT